MLSVVDVPQFLGFVALGVGVDAYRLGRGLKQKQGVMRMSGALEIFLRAVAVAVSDVVCAKIIEHAEIATATLAEKVDKLHGQVEMLGQVIESIPNRADCL